MGMAPGSADGEKGTGVQLIFAGETLIGFYFRDDYEEILRSTVAADGGRTFAWDKGDASLTRTPNGGMRLVVHERGKPESVETAEAGKDSSRGGCCPAHGDRLFVPTFSIRGRCRKSMRYTGPSPIQYHWRLCP